MRSRRLIILSWNAYMRLILDFDSFRYRLCSRAAYGLKSVQLLDFLSRNILLVLLALTRYPLHWVGKVSITSFVAVCVCVCVCACAWVRASASYVCVTSVCTGRPQIIHTLRALVRLKLDDPGAPPNLSSLSSSALPNRRDTERETQCSGSRSAA